MLPELLDAEELLPRTGIERFVDFVQKIPHSKKVGYLLFTLIIDTIITFTLSSKFFPWTEIVKFYGAALLSILIYGYSIFLLIRGISFVIQKITGFHLKIRQLDFISTSFILAGFAFISLLVYAIGNLIFISA